MKNLKYLAFSGAAFIILSNSLLFVSQKWFNYVFGWLLDLIGVFDILIPMLLSWPIAITLIIIGFAGKPEAVKRIRCDGCKEIIQGDYIAIRPEGTDSKYDYCGKACRDEYHPQHMKEIGRDCSPATE